MTYTQNEGQADVTTTQNTVSAVPSTGSILPLLLQTTAYYQSVGQADVTTSQMADTVSAEPDA
jgi:hypothetical protein